ncbi:MAG: class IV adenylate cyclase [Nanoarchaeota archaeon]|nr:class IV adenylate cyclase [Nanoarchaeota archaeon]
MEYERKATLKNKQKVMEYIKSKGFAASKHSHQIDTYFSKPNREDFIDKYLRIRQDLINKKNSIDYHIVRSDTATEEFESDIDNAEVLIHILKGIGMELLCIVDKDRNTFRKDNILIVIDHVKDLGDFIEIEVDADNEADAEKIIYGIFTELEINSDDIISGKGYPDLLLDKIEQD